MTTNGHPDPNLRRSLRLTRPVPSLATAIADDPGLLAALPGLEPHPSGEARAFRLHADAGILDLVADGDGQWILHRDGSEDRSAIHVDQRGTRLDFVADGFDHAAGQEDARLAMAALYQLACNLEAVLVARVTAAANEQPAEGEAPPTDAPAHTPASTAPPPSASNRMPVVVGAAALAAVVVGIGLMIRRRTTTRPRRLGS
ncbi:MAG: hypothetical protein JJT89_11925 [Nitriliruptoraceae bacterium]|nr:hypothetical protein [Nitriliruptoraceae bacterium]